ncbi:hypothetical protein F4804DRAFT_301971 [Jackrogersella minutella]|nr:hypothetical protein F4804DRAFT_301971 [Jackrogersella minutella]
MASSHRRDRRVWFNISEPVEPPFRWDSIRSSKPWTFSSSVLTATACSLILMIVLGSGQPALIAIVAVMHYILEGVSAAMAIIFALIKSAIQRVARYTPRTSSNLIIS